MQGSEHGTDQFCAWFGIKRSCAGLHFHRTRALAGEPSTHHPLVFLCSESKPILWSSEIQPGNTNRNLGATAEGTSKALLLLNKTRICIHFLGGKYYHMCLKLPHHLVCVDMNPLGRVSIWLGKRFPSPSPPHLPHSGTISCRCWNKLMTPSHTGMLAWEECSRASGRLWPSAMTGLLHSPACASSLWLLSAKY